MDKGPEQVLAVLGTLLAGGAYLPVDTTQPPARRAHLLAAAGVRHVLTQSWLEPVAGLPHEVATIAVDTLDTPGASKDPAPQAQITPDDLAYVIYTSGSTGQPKGVMMSHRGAVNTVVDINRRFGVSARDRLLGLANLGFDLSVYDVLGTLSAGATLVLPDPARRGDPSHWAELAARHGVTMWNSVPAQLQMLSEYLDTAPGTDLRSLRLALLSGDWIPVSLPDRIRAQVPTLRVVSLGGATEAAIWSIFHPIEEVPSDWRSIPYGRPLANQRFHVLDEQLRPRPDWVAGQLYIGGSGLAQGYLGNLAETAERFIHHPDTGERLYRTGDLGRYLPDGTIEFLGRADSQLKVRGHRIEPGEIEAALESHPSVGACVVIADGDQPVTRRLVAFVEPAHSPTADVAELRNHLSGRLPDYLLPTELTVVDSLPLTDNGKVDRRRLRAWLVPRTARHADSATGGQPRDELEASLARQWARALDLPVVARDRDFFELGGDSMSIAHVVGAAHQEVPEAAALPYAVVLRQMMSRPTVAALAEFLRTQASGRR
jgi:pyochelin synthetase